MQAKLRDGVGIIAVLLVAFLFEPAMSEDTASHLRSARKATFQRLRHADNEPDQWMATGRDLGGTFYSPLKQINFSNASRLGFAWQFKTDTYHGMEGTPLFVDGTLYIPGVWGSVYALDASNGAKLWSFVPSVDGQAARWAGEDVVSRGLSVFDGKVYTVVSDCRLFALDARTGHVLWSTQTLADATPGYMCEGGALVTDKLVIVGNSGGENGPGGIRGYVSAFNRADGKFAWRFYTTPNKGDPSPSSELQAAESTWDPNRPASYGGGGAVWGLMSYDPDLDFVYFGTGNAAPYDVPRDWTGDKRTDRLYAASIIALHASTGRMAWYYQTTPGDVWDFDATMNLVLAKAAGGVTKRKVLFQANKNGYFYVLDRQSGKVLSAKPFAYMNWSTGIDSKFRPIVSKDVADYRDSPKIVYPSMWGAHNWPPMSYSAASGLVYIPAIETGNIIVDVKTNPGSSVTDLEGYTGVAGIMPDNDLSYSYWESMVGSVPRFPAAPPDGRKPLLRGVLKAWDPIKGVSVWERQTSRDYLALGGGILSTGGRIVVAGREDGRLVIYNDLTGEVLRELDTGSAMMAAPMTYELNGTQYISVLCGHGGGSLSFQGTAALEYLNEGRLLTFVLDGMPAVPKPPTLDRSQESANPPPRTGSPELGFAGKALFFKVCSRCHSIGIPGVAPDLTRSATLSSISAFKAVVLKGALLPRGMGRFDDELSDGDVQAIHSYLIDEAWDMHAKEERSGPKSPQSR